MPECPLKPLFLYTLYMFCFEAKSSVSFYLSLSTSLALSPCIPHHLCFFPFHFSFIPRYPFHLTLFSPSFLSGAFVDWVQLPDDDGTSAERKPKRDGGRPLHTPRLSAEMEGLYTRLSVCITNILNKIDSISKMHGPKTTNNNLVIFHNWLGFVTSATLVYTFSQYMIKFDSSKSFSHSKQDTLYILKTNIRWI